MQVSGVIQVQRLGMRKMRNRSQLESKSFQRLDIAVHPDSELFLAQLIIGLVPYLLLKSEIGRRQRPPEISCSESCRHDHCTAIVLSPLNGFEHGRRRLSRQSPSVDLPDTHVCVTCSRRTEWDSAAWCTQADRNTLSTHGPVAYSIYGLH